MLVFEYFCKRLSTCFEPAPLINTSTVIFSSHPSSFAPKAILMLVLARYRVFYLPHPPLPPPPASSTPSVIEIASRTPRPSFRPTILSAPLRPRLPPSILMLRILAGHGCRQHPAPANLLFVTVQTFRKDERRSDANEWQRLNDQRRRGSRPKALSHVGAGFKPCQKIGNGSKPKGKARQWTDG